MATDAEFIETIRAHPDDDVPRLIYADWLEERDDPRGEFIRVQIQLAGMAPDDPARWDLELRQGRIRQKHGWQWIYKPFDQHAYYQHPEFVRGFVEGAEIPASLFFSDPAEFFRTYPLLHTLALLELEEQDLGRLLSLDAVPPLRRFWFVFFQETVRKATRTAIQRRFGVTAVVFCDPIVHLDRYTLRPTRRYTTPDYFIHR